ncbi:protein NRT1/ PTR FAMILY 1.2-like isoform X1 [Tasmannia lanceolata]|uniref:protein NRT1/ PTR FAMILY 1.2-like isoform X1 n=1 Tax=Tasmannia lanceolata TaxID=3420 RepID=UPI0040629F98
MNDIMKSSLTFSRLLNKACIITNPQEELNSDGSSANPWNLCTVEQVEELKSLIKVIPMWSTGIVIAVNISQNSFPVLQANSMDRHLGPKFQITAGSYGIFSIVTMTIWIAIYDRIIVPLMARLTGRPRGFSLKQRMGIGLLLTCIGTGTSAMVESVRRRNAIRQGLSENPLGVVDMTAMWLVPQHCLTGLAEAFNAIGQIEFYYSELPHSMSSIGVALFSLGMAIGNLMATAIVGVVDHCSKRNGKDSWVSNNINKAHFDYYYWILTGLGLLNFLYFLLCSFTYGRCKKDRNRVLDEGDETKEEEEGNPREVSVMF